MGLGRGCNFGQRANCPALEPGFIRDSKYGGHCVSSRQREGMRASSYNCTHLIHRNNATPRSRISNKTVYNPHPKDCQLLTSSDSMVPQSSIFQYLIPLTLRMPQQMSPGRKLFSKQTLGLWNIEAGNLIHGDRHRLGDAHQKRQWLQE